jgi:hypothetical protein
MIGGRSEQGEEGGGEVYFIMTLQCCDIAGDDGEPEEAPGDDEDERFQASRTTTGKKPLRQGS